MVGTVVAAGPDVAGFEVGDRVGGVVSIGLVNRTRPDLVTQRRTELWDLLAAGRRIRSTSTSRSKRSPRPST